MILGPHLYICMFINKNRSVNCMFACVLLHVTFCSSHCMLLLMMHGSMFIISLFVIASMFSRGSLPSSSSKCPADALREDITDLFADNVISGARTTRMLKKAFKAGVKVPKRIKQTMGKNQARALRRHMLKRTKWPSYYFFRLSSLGQEARQRDCGADSIGIAI